MLEKAFITKGIWREAIYEQKGSHEEAILRIEALNRAAESHEGAILRIEALNRANEAMRL